jgi:hypothetical protein
MTPQRRPLRGLAPSGSVHRFRSGVLSVWTRGSFALHALQASSWHRTLRQ